MQEKIQIGQGGREKERRRENRFDLAALCCE